MIFALPPVLSSTYVLFLSKRWGDKSSAGAAGNGHSRYGVRGKSLVPLAEVESWLALNAPKAVACRQQLYYRPMLRDAAEQLIGAWCVWCDIDLKDTADAAQRLAAFSPRPTWVIWSGGGYHGVWLLAEFCADPDRIESINLALAQALGGDKTAAKRHNGLAVPGTVNWKYETAAPEIYTRAVLPNAGSGRPVHIDELPVLERKKSLGKASNFRELYLRWFSDYPTPEKDEWMVCCPWHEDDTASLSINVENGMYCCHADGCGVKGSAISFLARMEGVAWKEARKALDHLKVRKGLVDLIESHLRTACTPLYRDGAAIVVADHDRRYHRFHSGSRSQIVGSVQSFLDGSPAMQITNAVGDDVDTDSLNKMILEAVLQLGQNLPDISELTLLGDGVHYRDDRILLASGGRLSYRTADGAWAEVTDLPYDKTYLPWYPDVPPPPWYAAAPNRLGAGAHTQLLRWMVDLLSKSWTFSTVMDALWLAAYTVYLPHWQAFQTGPIHFHITGPSASGKSALTEGWFAGMSPESVCMSPGAAYRTNTSAAGIYQTMHHGTRPLILDEILDHDNRRTREVLELIRNMEAGGSAVERGTQDGRSRRRWHVMFPTITSSIKMPDLIQDMNRRLTITLPHIEPAPPSPWQTALSIAGRTNLEHGAAMAFEYVPTRRSHLLESVAYVEALMAGVEGSSYRLAKRLSPLLAILHDAGVSLEPLVADLAARVAEAERTARAVSPQTQLRHLLLYHTFIPVGYDGVTSMAREIDAGGPNNVDARHVGTYLDRARGLLLAYPARLAQMRIDMGGISIIGALLHLDGCRGYAAAPTSDGAFDSCIAFDARTLLSGNTVERQEQPCASPSSPTSTPIPGGPSPVSEKPTAG